MSTVKSIHLAFGIHNHQPVGNPPSIFEQVFAHAYEPFLKVLSRHPKIKVSMHFSGNLLQWLRENRPEYTAKLKELNTKGQVELLTGGFYEPILPAIPDRDKTGQIGKLSKYIEEHFAFTPKGMWTTERVWEPHLPKSLAESGVEYTVLDESHFRSAGLFRREDICGYYATEEQGYTVAVFPIAFELRRAIPYRPVSEVLDLIKSYAGEEGGGLLCFADDGEKFGEWPGSYKSVYEKEWLEKFFKKLQETPWIKITTFSEYRKKFPPRGRLYIPAASYPEMAEWALPPASQKIYLTLLKTARDDGKIFMRGGMWRDFLVKYPEANNLHKKQLYVSHKVEKVKELEVKTRAQEDLWRGQANDAYWHGVFGGLYLPHLRSSVYQHLIKSEYLVDIYLHRGGPWLDVEIADYDKDLMEEVLVNSDKLNLYFRPAGGGQLFELDFKSKACNLQNLMSRREEFYHDRIRKGTAASPNGGKSVHDPKSPKEPGLEKCLHYDWYPRYSLIDHFLHPHTTLDFFSKAAYGEQGDFVDQAYHFDVERSHEQACVKLWRDGHVWVGKDFQGLRVEKKITVGRGQPYFTVEFHLANAGAHPLPVWYAPEFSFNFLSAADPQSGLTVDGKFVPFTEMLDCRDAGELVLKDGLRRIQIEMSISKSARLWQFPIETVSQSESGFERVFQGTVLAPNWNLTLGPKGTWKTLITIGLKEIAPEPAEELKLTHK